MTYLANITAAAAPYLPSAATIKTLGMSALTALTSTTGLVTIGALASALVAYKVVDHMMTKTFRDMDLSMFPQETYHDNWSIVPVGFVSPVFQPQESIKGRDIKILDQSHQDFSSGYRTTPTPANNSILGVLTSPRRPLGSYFGITSPGYELRYPTRSQAQVDNIDALSHLGRAIRTPASLGFLLNVLIYQIDI